MTEREVAITITLCSHALLILLGYLQAKSSAKNFSAMNESIAMDNVVESMTKPEESQIVLLKISTFRCYQKKLERKKDQGKFMICVSYTLQLAKTVKKLKW